MNRFKFLTKKELQAKIIFCGEGSIEGNLNQIRRKRTKFQSSSEAFEEFAIQNFPIIEHP